MPGHPGAHPGTGHDPAFYSSVRSEEVWKLYIELSQDSQEHPKAVALLSKMIDARIELLRVEMKLSLSAMFSAFLGGACIGIGIMEWNRGSRDASQAALLRFLLEERGYSPNKSSNTDAGDAGAG